MRTIEHYWLTHQAESLLRRLVRNNSPETSRPDLQCGGGVRERVRNRSDEMNISD